MPLSNKTILDSHCFVHELKTEMHDDLEYVKSLEKEIDELESEKADFSNIYDLLLKECVSKDVTCSYLHSLSDLNANTELQCLYLHKVKECECLALKLSKQTESVNNEVHNKLLKSFAKLEKHSISLELSLQHCKEQMKNNPVCKENASNVFRNETTAANEEIQVSDVGLTYYYALTVNPTIYTSCIKQFWVTAKVKTINGEVHIQALVDGKKVIVTETSVRRALQLKDAEGTECLPNATIFEQLTLMGSTKPITDEDANEEHVPTHSNDLLFSGEDRLQLKELLELYTKLSESVLDLENTKTSQATKITKLKERAKKLERRNKSRTLGLKRLRKGRKIANLDADAEEVEVEKAVSTAEVTTISAITTTVDELTLGQTLIKIKVAKSKAITTACRNPAKEKCKAKMIEPEKPLKKKDQILIVKEIAQKLQAQLNAELEEEDKLAKQREEDANMTEWDNVQAMINADYELAARLRAQEQEELTVEENSKLFVELIDKRKKHFARLRAEEQRRNPPTKA
ncbi:hypothetical protein Tco_0639278 [Tanacetum coccineum]